MELKGCACPIYIIAWCNMISKKNKAKTDVEKLQVIIEFAEKFTMLPSNWLSFLQLSKKCHAMPNPDNFVYLYSTKYGNKNAKHIDFPCPTKIIYQLRNNSQKNEFKEAKDALTFPYQHHQKLFKMYMFYSTKPPSKVIAQSYQKFQKLYAKIKECRENIDEWLKCLEEIDDKEAVIANFELKLGQDDNWTNKKIWDAYFKFLKENKRQEILDAYRKHTRLFITDKKAVESYRNEIEKFSSWNLPTTKYWIDTIKYEMDFGDLKFAYRLLENAIKAVLGQIVKITVFDKMFLTIMAETWKAKMEEYEKSRSKILDDPKIPEVQETTFRLSIYFTNPKKAQYFCFRRSFIQHLLKSANALILRKLYATCKFFYAFHKIRLCYRLEIFRPAKSHYLEEALYFSENCKNNAILQNLYIYGIFICIKPTNNQNLLSSVIQKLYCCRATHLIIANQILKLTEFKFLLSETLKQIYFKNVEIYENEKKLDGMCIFNSTRSLPALKYFEMFNKQNCICWSHNTEPKYFPETLKQYKSEYCEIIYFEEKQIEIQHITSLLQSKNLKCITIQNTNVKSAAGHSLSKEEIETFVKTKVSIKVVVKIN